VDGGAVERLRARGHCVAVEIATRRGPFRDTASSAAAVNREVTAKVRAAVALGRLPLVLAGSCVTSHGVLAGFGHAGCGAVWIDAHADFNTPVTTASGFFPGMSLAVITGDCYADYWAQIGDSTPLEKQNVVLFGVRELSPDGERERLEASSIRVVSWRNGRAAGDTVAPLDDLAARVDEIYLHLDLDAFAPDVAPGIADEPVPGGLSFEDAARIIRAAGQRFRVRAATLATYVPAKDEGDRTLRLALRLIDLIAESARPRFAGAT
jgi:arginase